MGAMRYTALQQPSSARYDGSPYVGRHPEDSARWLGRLLLAWVTPLMRSGHHQQLTSAALWPLRRDQGAAHNHDRFASELASNGASIPRAFLRLFGLRFALTGVGFLVSMLCALVGPVVLHHVVAALTEQDFALTRVSSWLALLFVAQVTQAFVDRVTNYEAELMAIQSVAALKALLFTKAMRLHASARRRKSTGAIANMFTADCETILRTAFLVHQAWLLPLQIVVVSFMLHNVLGIAAFAGIAVIVALLVLNHYVSRHLLHRQRVYRASKDARMKRVTEVFQAIAMVKFHAWEVSLGEGIQYARHVEMRDLFRVRLLAAVAITLLRGMPIFISVVSFGVYAVVLQEPLSPAIVFTSVALFQLIRGPLRQLPDVVLNLIQSRVALERVASFLAMREQKYDENVVTMPHGMRSESALSSVMVSVVDGTFAWRDGDGEDINADANGGTGGDSVTEGDGGINAEGASDHDDTSGSTSVVLRGANWKVHAGELHVVHGPVGCGKSSLCLALLGEMVKRHGSVHIGGRVAYCSQKPWIQNLTVRGNILFGAPFQAHKYDKVVRACALMEDLEALPAGDLTEIGERGVNLSGGQQARIALARACYSDASVFILDAPLSAVDAIVQNEIFQKCLRGLLRKKTVILVTHNPEIIASPHVTQAVTITPAGHLVTTHQALTRPENENENGKEKKDEPMVSPLAQHVEDTVPWSFSAARTSGYDEDMDRYSEEDAVEVDMLDEETTAEMDAEDPVMSPCKPSPRVTSVVTFHRSDRDERAHAKREHAYATGIAIASAHAQSDGRLIQNEALGEGRVKNHIFAAYARALGGVCGIALIVLPNVLAQGFQLTSDLWLSSWSSDSMSGTTLSTTDRISGYALLGFGAVLMVLARMIIIAFIGLRAAQRLFDAMTDALLHAPMRFFDANPIGRILTRYAGDVSVVDSQLPFISNRTISALLSLVLGLFTAAVVIQWQGLLLVLVVYVYYRIGMFYIYPARDLQRLTRTTQAPVLNHLAESVDGTVVVRAFGSRQVARFTQTEYDRLDDGSQVQVAQLAVSQWFSLHIQLLGTALVMIVAVSLVLLRHQLPPSLVGLAFSYALRISQNLETIVQLLSRVETAMVSPERIQEYVDIPQERPHRLPDVDSALRRRGWPLTGRIQFQHVSFRYKDNDSLVLSDISFAVGNGEKLGIVGRTGAGKSSLTMALFRLNELAGGSIAVDGVDISSIGLRVLRETLCIIPQQPVLFKGTLRNYLDPWAKHSEHRLADVIARVGLHDRIAVDVQYRFLDAPVEQNGDNFSVGERQMLCMARALLRDSRIVIFDEATAAIDHETDQKLQRVIREAFAESTVLTIAHRLDTILDADRILVLDAGRVVQLASPSELVTQGDGHFFELMREGGYLANFLASAPPK